MSTAPRRLLGGSQTCSGDPAAGRGTTGGGEDTVRGQQAVCMPCERLACWHGRGYGGRGSGDSGAGRVDEAQVAAAEITGRGPGAIVRGIRAARGMTLAELGK